MNIQAILFDADGVALKKRDKFFSERFAEDFQKPEAKDKIVDFLQGDYKKIRLGQAGLKEEVGKRMKDWGWEKSVEELLQYWFEYENEKNEQVLALVNSLRTNGIKCYLASDHSKYRAQDLMDNVFNDQFDGGFFSCDLKTTKADLKFYDKISADLEISPRRIFFVDDEEENVEAARKAGITAYYYQNFADFKQELAKQII